MGILILAGILAFGCTSTAQAKGEGLPALHQIQAYTFEKPYSCGGDYKSSALFLSEYAKDRNAPDLLFNCYPNPDGTMGFYVSASTAGDDLSVVSDLGDVSLETVTTSKTMNYDNVVGHDNIFKQDMSVAAGHTYVVLISKSNVRALYAFRVESITRKGWMNIKYAVKLYSVQNTQSESPGFDWEQRNR